MKTVLSIAGSDSCGGAGIQADIKTLTMNGVYAMSAVTALTAQNTLGVKAISEVTPQFLQAQLEAVFDDIPPDAVKIGMVGSSPLIRVIGEMLKKYKAKNIVLDPVMVSTSGDRLTEKEAVCVLQKELFPLASIITPNLPEAEILLGRKIESIADRENAVKTIAELTQSAVLLKGGHDARTADDLLFFEGHITWIPGNRINNPNSHGTGCTLSSAIAANLAKGYSLREAVVRAKEYVTGALSVMFDLGKGSGPLNHAYDYKGYFAEGPESISKGR